MKEKVVDPLSPPIRLAYSRLMQLQRAWIDAEHLHAGNSGMEASLQRVLKLIEMCPWLTQPTVQPENT